MNNTILVNYYTIDNVDYIVVNRVEYKGFSYVYLINENDKNDFLIRRIEEDKLEPLNSEEELMDLMKLLIK